MSNNMQDEEFTILTPNDMLGYGYRLDHFWYGIEKYKPSAIIVDSGSTDGGPFKLGTGKMTCGRASYVRDLGPTIDAAYHKKIKLLISSVGGDGSNVHVQEMLGIVQSIAQEKGYSFKIATINAGIDRDFISSRLKDGKVGPCGPVPPLTEDDVRSAVDVVAQMGCEPYLRALTEGDPDIILGPGGVLVLDDAKYDQITEKTTRVSGARLVPSKVYQIKLEGVQKLGYRTIFIGGVRDPILIAQIDDFLDRVRRYTQSLFPKLDSSENCRLLFQIYGKNAVMGPLEPSTQVAHEIGVFGKVLAPTQELSHTIANNARASILHFPYPDQIATSGNFASPMSPHEQEAGPVFKFSLYHLVDLAPGEECSLFPISYHQVTSDSLGSSKLVDQKFFH